MVNVSTDAVVVGYQPGQGLQVFLPHRNTAPYEGARALPGVLISEGETTQDAVLRAIRTKTDLPAEDIHPIKASFFSEPGRDPRSPTLSVSYLCPLRVNLTHMQGWVLLPPAEQSILPELGLGFDHETIVADALSRLVPLLLEDMEVSRTILGETFTVQDFGRVIGGISTVLGRRVGPVNISQTLLRHPNTRIEGMLPPTGASGRPGNIYTWKD